MKVSWFPKFKSSSSSKDSFRRHAGFTLIEMVVGLAIGTVGILIFSSGVLATLASAAAIQSTATRDELSLFVRRTILDRRALKATVQRNPVMKAVFENNYQSPFATVYSNTEYGITLYDSSGTAVSGPEGDFINPTASALYYTSDGTPCSDPKRPQCTFAVKSSFIIQSIPKYTSGVTNQLVPNEKQPLYYKSIRPDFLQINYVIEQRPNAAMKNQIEMRPVQGSIFIDYEDLGN